MEEDEPSSAPEDEDEEEDEDEDAEDEEEEEEEEDKVGCKAVSEYEKQRLSRIKENRARLEALGLPRLASSLLASARAPSKPQQPGQEETSKRTAKKKKKGDGRAAVDDEDDEYQPSDDGDGDSSRSSEEEELEDYRPSPSRPALTPRGKGKKKDSLNSAKVRRSLYVKEKKDVDAIDDDIALKQAIAISLGGTTEDSVAVSAGRSQSSFVNVANASTGRRVDNASIQVAPAKRKRKGNVSRVQLSEDEVVAYFFSFDEAGKGQITLRDLQRMAVTHDFCWTDIEMANMIRCFDSNKDGKLSLDDFRTIVTRCNMLQESTGS